MSLIIAAHYSVKRSAVPALLAILLAALGLTGCSTTYPNKKPVNQPFPVVSGETLEQKTVQIPQHMSGESSVLLLGYVQNAQFDIDRWLIGLDMTNTKVAVYELPTLQGMFPQFFQTQINEGMRKGIPKSLWKGVITVYEDGDLIQQFTGNTNPNNARVLLLDSQGKIQYFYDEGFSVEALKSLKNSLSKLATQ